MPQTGHSLLNGFINKSTFFLWFLSAFCLHLALHHSFFMYAVSNSFPHTGQTRLYAFLLFFLKFLQAQEEQQNIFVFLAGIKCFPQTGQILSSCTTLRLLGFPFWPACSFFSKIKASTARNVLRVSVLRSFCFAQYARFFWALQMSGQ